MKTMKVLLVLLFAIGLLIGCAAPPAPPATTQAPSSSSAAPAATTAPAASSSSAASQAAGQPKKGGTLTIARSASPMSMNSIIDPGSNGLGALGQMHEGLFGVDTKGDLGPRLAEAAPENPDPLTYIFHLKKGVKFATGEELTATDVKYSFERLMDPKNNASFGGPYRDNIAKIDVVDPYTVKFTLKQPWPIFTSMTGSTDSWVINQKTAEIPDFGTKWWNGTGAFVLTEWVQGDHFTMTRNDKYREAGYPLLDKIIYKVIPDVSTQLANLETGQLDVVQQPSFSDVDRLKKDSRFKVITRDSNLGTIVHFNTARAPFDDKRVRQAMSLAINRQELVDSVFYGYADIAGDQFPVNHWAHDPSIKAEYNVDKAKQLLADAGYGPNKPLQFTLGTYRISQYADQAVLIQSQLGKIGVKVNVQQMDNAALIGILRTPRNTWTVDAALNGIDPLRGTAYEFACYLVCGKGSLNYTGYNQDDGFKNPQTDTLFAQATKYSDYVGADRDAAKPIYSQISKLVLDDAPILRLNFWKQVTITQKWVMDYAMAEADINQLWKTWIDK